MLLGLVASGASLAAPPSASPEAEQLAAAKARWRAQHARDYSYSVEVLCFCVARSATINVVDRKPRRTPAGYRDLDTARDLFHLAARVVAGERSHEVRYRHHRGLPRRITIRPLEGIADSGITYVIGKPHITRRYQPRGVATNGCPRRSQPPPAASPFGEADNFLVPDGARSALLCRYRGLSSDAAKSLTLARSRSLDQGHVLRMIVARLNALEPWPFSTLPHSCPFDDASQVVAYFRYPDGSTSPVTVNLQGCNEVTNGRISRTASTPPGPELLAQLRRLTRYKGFLDL